MKPGDLERYARELGAALESIDRERADLADVQKERRGRIKALEKEARRLRDYVTGRNVPQLEVPGTEVSNVLAEACRVASCKACGGRGGNPGYPCLACGRVRGGADA